jgi:hypothetical protein
VYNHENLSDRKSQTLALLSNVLLAGRLRSMLTAEETRSTTNVRLSLARQLAETLLHSISDSKYKVYLTILKCPLFCTNQQCCGSGIRCLFDPWIRIRDKKNPDHISESLKNSFLTRIQDQVWKKFGSGIPDKHPGSATLLTNSFF